MTLKIESNTFYNRYGDRKQDTSFFVDGEHIGSGSYGGEPEDNTRFRDYNWVEPLIAKIARRLGATVEIRETSENLDER